MKKKILSMAIVVCMLLSMMPTMVFAAEEIPYLDENGTEQTCASATEVTAEDTVWTAGWYIAQGEVTLANRVEVQGDVHLILADGAKLTAPSGIKVQDNDKDILNGSPNKFTIYAQSTGEATMGRLEAVSYEKNAAIGSSSISDWHDDVYPGGEITITGGIVTAKGGIGAGIGGGGVSILSKKGGDGGTITITGGIVTATSEKGQGIGAGFCDYPLAVGLGEPGIFTTGEKGNAVIFASSIGDQSRKDSWEGVIFEGTEGKSYGDNIIVESDFEIPQGYILTVEADKKLTIGKGATLTNNGTIVNNGTIKTYNTFAGGGTVQGNSVINLTDRNVKYLDENGEEQICVSATKLMEDDTIWNEGWYIAKGDVTITDRVQLNGDVHLILADGAKLNVPKGISLYRDSDRFTVYAQSTDEEKMGKLEVSSEGYKNAIGDRPDAGEVTFNGGNVTITSEQRSGILAKTITINGGTVKSSTLSRNGGILGIVVTINGGTVTVSDDGYAIAGTTITISGGTVTATGERGMNGSNIAISGGNVTATGKDGGVGSGIEAREVITISGGTVTASGDAGIVGNNDITIDGGTVTATSKDFVGIYGKNITIGGGNVTVSGGRVGIEGPLSTGENGNAVIFASSISDQSQKDSWSGVIFEGTQGKVYGNVTPEGSFEIPANYTLNIPDGNTLTIDKDITLTNSGVIELGGKIINNGTIINNGQIIKISDNGAVEGSGNISGEDITDTVRNETYIDENGEEQICALAFSVKADDTVWSNGWYIVQGEVTLNNRPEVQGEVHLILADGAKLIAPMGIKVQDDDNDVSNGSSNKLTIYAQSTDAAVMGSLEATSYDISNAAIGSDFELWDKAYPGGEITIAGGIVTAKGGRGAGIGGGAGTTMRPEGGAGGTITITGGIVTAISEMGHGIGGGYNNALTEEGIGDGGTFTTGENGNAVIIASSMGDQSHKDSWKGIIFEGTEGKLYGDTVTPESNFEVPQGYTLTIEAGQKLTIDKNITLTNNGTINVNGAIINNGTIINNGIINNNGTIDDLGKIEGTGEITGSPVNSAYKDVKYIDENGEEQTANALGISASNVLWSNNWYIVKGEVTLTHRVEIQGDVHLILEDGAKLIAPFGIKVQDDDDNAENGSLNSLTIYAQSTDESTMGSIVATVSDDNASDSPIGSDGIVDDSGSLIEYIVPCGNITINGGNINAASDMSAAIGGGSAMHCVAGGNVTINGGTVKAQSRLGAGIGAGYCLIGGGGGNITINGGTVKAQSSSGAGIGGGGGHSLNYGTAGKITITGGSVTAISTYGHGIGGGADSENVIGEASAFTTGENGNAVIIASSIGEQSQKENWKGIIFEGTQGKVYGNVTPNEDFEVLENYTLDIPENITLTIAEDITMTNNGIVNVLGTVEKIGTIICNSHSGGTATCSEQASCSLCGTSYGKLKPHSIVETDGKEPTCEESGYEACWICENCGKLFAEIGKPVEIPARGHKLTKVEGKEATCGESGFEEYWTCDACKKMYSDADGINEIEAPVEIPALEHTLTKVEGKEATCGESGFEEYWKCEVCGKMYSDENGETEIAEPVEIPALAHTLTKTEGKEATCEEKGFEAYWTCEVCKKLFSDEKGENEITAPVEIPALGHTYEDGVCINCGKPEVKYELGDVNQDGKLDIDDATAIQCYVVLIPIEGIFNKELADVNQDGKITINDVTAFQIILTKK